jgi:hypothetical protein
MTAPSARIGLGTTLEMLTSGAEFEKVKIDWDGMTRTSHETTHLGTVRAGTGNHGSRTFIPGKVTDPGTLKVEAHFNPDEISLIEAAAEQFRITLPLETGQLSAAKWEGSGFVVNVGGMSFVADGIVAQTFEIKCSGEWDYTAAT